jgi:LacI family transcriptional regulator
MAEMTKRKTVVLMIETSLGYGRGLLRGTVKYAKLHDNWTFYRELPSYANTKQSKSFLSRLEKLKADGAIIRDPSPAQVEHFQKLGIPMIVAPNLINPQIPTIHNNVGKIAQLAVEHFIDRGFKNFAYCGFRETPWSKNRYDNFAQELRHRNFQINYFAETIANLINPKEKVLNKFIDWLRSLPKPVGLMACNDDMGQIVLDICKLAGIHVPEQIAVLGVDDDEFICELTTPPLSSIALNSERSGYEAAELLDKLMAGEKMNGQVIYQEPAYVITRQSTDVMAIDDQDVTQAIRFISEHYTEPIGVEDVASAVHLSRRHLYKKFLSAVGHTVADEIKKKRINHIRKLLLETDWSVYKITMSLRFTGIEHIARYFQKETGMPPNEYRKKFGR